MDQMRNAAVEKPREVTELDAAHDALKTHGDSVWQLVNRLEQALIRLGRYDNAPTAGIAAKAPEPNGHMNRIADAFGSLGNATQRAHELLGKLEKVL